MNCLSLYDHFDDPYFPSHKIDKIKNCIDREKSELIKLFNDNELIKIQDINIT